MLRERVTQRILSMLQQDGRQTKVYPLQLTSLDDEMKYPDTKAGMSYQGSNSLTPRMVTDEDADLEELSSPSRILARFAERSSMLGVLYIHTTQSRLGRLVWTLLLLSAFWGLALHTYLLASTFYSFETFAKVQMGYDNLQFPAVTLCNINPIMACKKDNVSSSLQKLISSFSTSQLIENADKGQKELQDSTWRSSGSEQTQGPPQPTDGIPTLGVSALPFTSSQDNATAPSGTATAPRGTATPIRLRRALLGDFSNYSFSDLVKDNRSRAPSPSHWEAEATQTTASLAQDEFEILYSQETRKVREAVAHQRDVFIQECSFAGRRCYAENFTFHWNSKYGACYTLQYSNLLSLDSGPREGLELLLYLQTEEYLRGLTNGNGLQVLVHDQGSFPFPSTEGFAVSSGTETFVPLRLLHFSRQQKPYGSCYDGDMFQSRYNTKYTRQLCQQVCLVRRIVEVCQCYEGRLEEIARLLNITNSTSQCRATSELICANNVSAEFRRDKSICSCYDPCEERKYVKSAVSSRQWPCNEYAELLARSMCQKKIKSFCNTSFVSDSFSFGKNFVKLNIFFEDLNYENITETPSYEWAQFASDVGGTLGLWIGLSVLSVFEIWQLVLELCLACTLHRHARDRNARQGAANARP